MNKLNKYNKSKGNWNRGIKDQNQRTRKRLQRIKDTERNAWDLKINSDDNENNLTMEAWDSLTLIL